MSGEVLTGYCEAFLIGIVVSVRYLMMVVAGLMLVSHLLVVRTSKSGGHHGEKHAMVEMQMKRSVPAGQQEAFLDNRIISAAAAIVLLPLLGVVCCCCG
jgi:hypothetical protein